MLIYSACFVIRGDLGSHFAFTVPLPLLRHLIRLRRSRGEVFLIDDIIAVKDRPCLPAANVHDSFFVHAQPPQLPASSSLKIVLPTPQSFLKFCGF